MATQLDIEAIRAAIKMQMERKGWSRHKLSLVADLNESAVRDLFGSVANPRFGTLLKLAYALDVSPATLFGGQVLIAGTISEDGEILPILRDSGEREMVSLPPDLGPNIEAYQILHGGLMPAFWPNDILFVSRDHDAEPEDFLDHQCVVQFQSDGSKWLRTVEEGSRPGRFNLSFKNLQQPIENVPLAWAAPVLSLRRPGIKFGSVK